MVEPFSKILHQYGRYGLPVFTNFFGIEFYLTLVTNKGAAWGLLSELPLLLISVRIGIVVALIGYLFFKDHNWIYDIPLVLIITGAIGNLIDTFIYGFVVDFLFFRFWGYNFPVFNVADALISVGVLVLLAQLTILQPKEVSSR